MPNFSVDQLQKIGEKILIASGASRDEAEMVARLLAMANLVGHDSHGVIRIPQYLSMIEQKQIIPNAKLEIVEEAPSSAVISGNWGFGQVIATKAIEIAIEKAKSNTISSVAVRECNHIGRLADYAKMASHHDLIAMVVVNNHGAGARVAPFGGIEGRFSTNPICYAIPRRNAEPITVDITTSVVAEGKVRVKRNRNERVPEGWILDNKGNPTTNAHDLYADPSGAILPFGGPTAHKGFALSVVVDILAGALSGAGCSRGAGRLGNAIFMTVIDPSRFTPIEKFFDQIEELVKWVKSSKTADGFDEILFPGEPESKIENQRRKDGILVEDETWREICKSAEKLGVQI